MKRIYAILILLAGLLTTSGCAVAVLGMGAAAGTGAAYVTGKDTRTYDSDYRQTAQACMETLAALRMPVSQTSADELKTTIQARRADETPVTIEVVRSGQPGRSEVGVRTGVVGISGMETSNRIHDALKERLRRKDPEPAKTTATPQRQMVAPEQPPEIPSKRSPGRKTEAPSSTPYARKAPPELTIYFVRDSNELQPSETAKLDQVAETIRRQPEARLTLSGYTDSAGSGDYNLMIAESRASSVKLYLVAKGADPLRVTVAGKGAKDFVASNDSEEGRTLNRRVEIRIENTRR